MRWSWATTSLARAARRAGESLAPGFFPADFLDADFFAVAFFAVAFLAPAFLAAGRLAADFLAADFFAPRRERGVVTGSLVAKRGEDGRGGPVRARLSRLARARFSVGMGPRAQPSTFRTSLACGPFCPCTISNSTRSPSASDLKPCAWMALKWTKTSGPPSREMNPKPFASLNHFTVPSIRAMRLPSFCARRGLAVSRARPFAALTGGDQQMRRRAISMHVAGSTGGWRRG